MTNPDIPENIPGLDLEGEETITGPELIDDTDSKRECVDSAPAHANIERNNHQPANITGMDKEYQEPIEITPTPPGFEVIPLPI